MMGKRLLAIVVVFISSSVWSQDLYKPRDVNQAYVNQTRSEDGNPGKNYWQNGANYTIKLKIDPPNRTVYGEENITYFNNSPDTLKRINFKLILNHHKPGAPRMNAVSEDYLTSGMHITSYKEGGVSRKFSDVTGINKYLKLSNPLLPGDSVQLYFKWHFDLSKQSGREGAIDSTTFFLAYFYPRVAVYDDYSGWDLMRVQGSKEFYNDFNNYTFSVRVPKNYIVWATGVLQNVKEVLQTKYAKRLTESMQSDSIIKIVGQSDIAEGKITKQNDYNTWQWKAKNVTDIAIALSDHYNWDAGSVVVDNKTERRASVQAAYDEPSKDFQKMVQYGKHSLAWFSNNYPGLPYPYPKSTIVRGFADMEYPMMVNDASSDKDYFTRFVAEHEIAHTYFPFYMGINETRFAFMDEGWATTLEYLIGIHDLGFQKASDFFKYFRVMNWINDPAMTNDLPIITPSNVLRGRAYGVNAYGKPALGYLAVKDLLGDALFTKALQGYMKRWEGKHPIPWDFFYSFNNITGKNLNWFWKKWFFSNNCIDFAISKVAEKKGNYTVTIDNIGGMPAPFDIVVSFENGKTKSFHQSPKIWKVDGSTAKIVLKDLQKVKKIELDGGIWMDANPKDNIWIKK